MLKNRYQIFVSDPQFSLASFLSKKCEGSQGHSSLRENKKGLTYHSSQVQQLVHPNYILQLTISSIFSKTPQSKFCNIKKYISTKPKN